MITFGQTIQFNQVLERDGAAKPGAPGIWLKAWKAKPVPECMGIVIGIRTLFTSEVEWYPDFTKCTNTEPVKALLVAYDMRRKPVYIPYPEATDTTEES